MYVNPGSGGGVGAPPLAARGERLAPKIAALRRKGCAMNYTYIYVCTYVYM